MGAFPSEFVKYLQQKSSEFKGSAGKALQCADAFVVLAEAFDQLVQHVAASASFSGAQLSLLYPDF